MTAPGSQNIESIATEPAPAASLRGLRVAYHGPVFDSTGYGNAARAYIHALHGAGVELAVRDVSTIRGPLVRCALIESLIAPPRRVDFHLFHGVPAIWAAAASAMRNAIGITVWETAAMPAEWLDPLRLAADVWVPCRFNQTAFGEALGREPFRLPHPVICHDTDWPREKCSEFFGMSEEEFAIYAIFEWQERKSPDELIRAYLQAFDAGDRTVLLIKTNAEARGAAHRTLARLRAETRSAARVELRCEAWEEAHIAALHSRGDCYLSLHRGEGWCYPLCEAACRGKAVVATGYSGPLDYLDPTAHSLVRYRLAPVRQKYRFYRADMLWAEPDCTHAAECLRDVYEQRGALPSRTGEAANRIRVRYSIEEVGRLGAERLLYLLRAPAVQGH